MEPEAPTPTQQPTNADLRQNPLSAMRDGESIVANIKRHPFGIVTLYIMAIFGIAAACAIVILLLPKLLPQSSSDEIMRYATAGIAVVLVGMFLMLGISTWIYWQNRWVVTSDSITQITQRGIFNRQVSQLSFYNLEDVTVEQRGIFPTLFNFGELKVETAGERSKFYFLYCPDPNKCARDILNAREAFLQRTENENGPAKPALHNLM
ncbi:MAG TPA: PH domain-containing protein [Candidatus Saccharimonadales bacterium]|jgi:uncharacterized membrane protein YdbT with pleckstrin-like domain|nr:PH domain-containing protein [Candidatus Saccharimonadales bacterium]